MNLKVVGLSALLVVSGCGLEVDPPAVGCGPSNCSGCCQDGVCVAGTAATQCGAAGATCSACAGHQACLSQACGLDPNQVWLVMPSFAMIKDTNNGNGWDPDGSAPDPYVTLNGVKGQVADNTVLAEWTQAYEIKASDLLAGTVTFQVLDEDTISDDKISNPYSLQLTEADFAVGKKAYAPFDAVEQFEIKLQKKP